MDFPERVSSKMQIKCVILEYCVISMSLFWMFGGFDFLVLCLLPSNIDFVLSSPKWILLYYLSTNQSQSTLNFLFSANSISVISLCWNIKQVSSVYSNNSQSTACSISFIYKRKRFGPKMDPWGSLHIRFSGSEKVFLIWTLNLLFEI